jgi:site-specific DNA-methyltransferase (adenine-specific)
MKNVWRFATPSAAEKIHGKHPTQKPVALITRCLRATTDPGDLVFDPFAGSGSTGVAAVKLGRRFIGCEQDRNYASLAARRVNDVIPGDTEVEDSDATASVPRRQQQVATKP